MALDHDTEIQLKDRFQALPPAVQTAITSAHLSEHLESLAKIHKLHLDQWQTLENEVIMTLLGLQMPDQLSENIEREVGVDTELAKTLAESIANEVFGPIRAELESILESSSTTGTPSPTPTNKTPATPQGPTQPGPQEERGVIAAPIDNKTYQHGQISNARKDVVGDPYRESIA